MRLVLLLVLALCVVLSAGDRQRSERADGDGQQRVKHRHRDGDEQRHHHYHDAQRRHWERHDDDDDDDDDRNDSDNEDDDDDDDHHHHRNRLVDLAGEDGSHWRRGHNHHGDNHGDHHRSHHGHDRYRGRDGHERRPETDDHGRGRGQKDGRKDWKKNGTKTSDSWRDGNSSVEGHHQEDRRRSQNHHSERHEHRDDVSRKSYSKSNKNAHHQGQEPLQGRPPAHGGYAQSNGLQQTSSGEQPLSAARETLFPAAESLAAAMAAQDPEPALLDTEDDPEAEPLPPPHQDVAAMARYIVHVSDWAAMATISTRDPTRGMPFANVFSVCDGTRYRSTGIPYLYLTDLEISVKDLRVNNSASLTMSLAQTEFCRRRGYDPEDPLCAHVILTGRVLQVEEGDPEFVFARDALFARHPEMSGWPAGHHFFVAKLDIQNIIVLDYFGGAKSVPVSEYFATNPFKVHPRRENML